MCPNIPMGISIIKPMTGSKTAKTTIITTNTI